ncbi:hypothetical protein EJ110_NYTH49640 [Nymphaea thermarum]|nr:hypothetical protein EJ110_NYTH49640 [Nymphaea thermarum]
MRRTERVKKPQSSAISTLRSNHTCRGGHGGAFRELKVNTLWLDTGQKRTEKAGNERAVDGRGGQACPNWKLGKDYYGAIDEAHILVYVRRENQCCWKNRKYFLSQNVLVVVDFNMHFYFVVVGKYYFANAEYTNIVVFLTPYYLDLYEYNVFNVRPMQNKYELFNYRHSPFCTRIERVFALLKGRFSSLKNQVIENNSMHYSLKNLLTIDSHNLRMTIKVHYKQKVQEITNI